MLACFKCLCCIYECVCESVDVFVCVCVEEKLKLDSNRRIENLDNWASGHSGPSGIYRLKHEIWTWKKDPGNKQIAMEQ